MNHKTSKHKRAQNLMEFIFVLPLLIFLTLGIFEVALFWQDVNSIYSLNTEINANLALIDPTGMALGSRCSATTKAKDILEKKDSMVSMNDPTYDTEIVDGKEPFALYRIYSPNVTFEAKPQITMWVDCRNPFENGVTSQIEFFHKTLVIRAAIPSFSGGDAIVIIPDHVFIASPKMNTIRHY